MTLTIIPARGGSRRIPRKSIREFHGYPIIAYSIETARLAGFDVVVTTDDDEIAEVAERYGAQILMRPPELCVDEVGTQQVMAWAVGRLGVGDDQTVVCLYPCAPLVSDKDLRLAELTGVLRPCSYVVAVAADPLRDIGNFYVGCAPLFARAMPLYDHCTGLYVMPPERAIDINEESDWIRAEQMYRALHPETK